MRFNINEGKRLGLYFHIPFCLSKCAYCDFNSSVKQDDGLVSEYISAMIAHMESYRIATESYVPDTVFIGGGTPTAINPEELVRLVKAIKRCFNLTKNVEFTIEANPATVTKRTLSRLRRLGVNRLSMGLQSAHENELRALSRCHSRRDFLESFKIAREAGFNNINVDLMFGIPHQTMDSLMHSLYYVMGLSPEHISLYDLKIEPGTPFYSNYRDIAPHLPSDDAEADMYESAVAYLAEHGYYQYEISNFATAGRMCAHNLKYWNCDEYLGFGVSAHSFFRGNRFSFISDVQTYIRGVMEMNSPIKLTDTFEEVEERERMGEYIMLRLRLSAGIDSIEFASRFGHSFEHLYGPKCEKYVQNGYMTHHRGVYALTPKGMFVSNYIISDILEFEDFGKYYFGG